MLHNKSDGAVPTDTVVHVLKAMSEMGAFSASIDNGALTIILEDIPDTYILSDYVPRKLLHVFSRKYSIPIHFFYNPEMMHSNKNKTIQ